MPEKKFYVIFKHGDGEYGLWIDSVVSNQIEVCAFKSILDAAKPFSTQDLCAVLCKGLAQPSIVKGISTAEIQKKWMGKSAGFREFGFGYPKLAELRLNTKAAARAWENGEKIS